MADMKPGDVSSAAVAGGAVRVDRAAGQPEPAPASVPPAAPRDTVSVLGIPETELTPRVQAAVTGLMGELQSLRRQLERMQERVVDLERLADRDTLTPLVNRRAFLRELDRTLAQVERHGTRASLLYIDLDGLKGINDRYGHAAGDAAILHFGEVVSHQVRRTDLVGRLGGDEFAVLLVQTEAEQAARKAAAIGAALERQPLVIEGQSITLGFSCGVEGLTPGRTAGEVMESADRAMYVQKQAKRSPVRG
jgi:diguanylate cyclase (GGDEF)-like protein